MHTYVCSHMDTHTYGTDTADNIANIPLGTPKEGSWEQGWLTKLGGKGAWPGPAWRKSWHHVNASATMIGEERPSPPLHNQHIIRKPISAWALKTRPGNLMFHHCPPFLLLYTLLSVVCPGRDGFRGFSPTWGWCHSGVWPSDPGITRLKPQQLMEHGEYKSDCGEINLTRKAFAIYQSFTSQTMKVGLVMMLASDWSSAFTN